MLAQTGKLPCLGYGSGRTQPTIALGLFTLSVCGIIILTALYSKPGTFWSELYSDLYEVSLAIATFTAVVVVFLTRDVPNQAISALIREEVMTVDAAYLTTMRTTERTRRQIAWFGGFLLTFWALGIVALYLGDIRPADFDRFGTWDILCGRFVWVSIFAWLFWQSINATHALTALLNSCELRPHLWTVEGDGGLTKIGLALLVLATPLIVGSILGAVWLLPVFAGKDGYQGAQAVAGILALVVGIALITVFVPCVWAAHEKLDKFRRTSLERIAEKLRALSSLVGTRSGDGAAASCEFAALNGLWNEIERLPSWPFSTKIGIFFVVTQVTAVLTALIKAGEVVNKMSSMFE